MFNSIKYCPLCVGCQSLKQMKPFDPGYLTLNRYYVSIPLVRELAL
jgi:hypothetical protein